jgi:hypothetical protein
MPQLGDLAQLAQATGAESGAMFVYSLATPLDLEAHHSALVPVLSRKVQAEAITWFGDDDAEALMGARLLNDTDQTLPAGTVSFFGDGGFAGESGFGRLKPGEQAFLVHGVDLDVDLERNKVRKSETTKRVTFGESGLLESFIVESELSISLHNRSGRDRTVYVGLPVARNGKIEGHDKLDYDHARDLPLAKYALGARSEFESKMVVTEADSRTTTLDSLDVPTLERLSREKELSLATREALGAALGRAREIDANLQARARRLDRTQQIEGELARLREDLRALGATGLKDKSARQLSQRVVELEKELRDARHRNERDVRAEKEHRAALAAALTDID